MKIDYIIVQAGGKGSRLGYLTSNKPKAIVPVGNLPIIFHLFRKFPDKRFIVIADYKKEVLREYLRSFADVKYQIVDAEGTGTCAGIRKAVSQIPDNTPFMLIWSDLILPEEFSFPTVNQNYIGISQSFPCRWSYRGHQFIEEPSSEKGVAGLFIFTERQILSKVPEKGELVRWMQEQCITGEELGLAGAKEFGILSEYAELEVERCRPFNRMVIEEDFVLKEGIDAQGKSLAVRECAWYQKARSLGVKGIPKIYSINPLKMEKIIGKNIYEYQFSYEEKRQILKKLVDTLKQLHSLECCPKDSFSIQEAYITKTLKRLNKIRDLVPFADQSEITINGRICKNIFFYKREFERLAEKLTYSCKNFCFIHGDCTFSNMMLRDNDDPVLLDPRGYFGFTELYGDSLYDWGKLYYSIAGNYDQFNLKRFRLYIEDNQVRLEINSNHWEDMEKDFFELTETNPAEIKLLHAVIWLSLTTYAWQDYDSICGAFYNGLYYLEEAVDLFNRE